MPDTSTGFGYLDWFVLISYFLGCTAFGLWVSRRVRTSGGYFLGERKLPWWIMIGQSFGTGTHAENPVAQAGATYLGGFATIWYQWKNMLVTPFYWLMAPWYRRSEKTTIGEIIEERFGRPLALVYTVFALSFFMFNQGVMLKGAGKIIAEATAISPGVQAISANGVVAAMTVAFILYSFFGGLIAAAYTDFVQGFLIIVLSFLLIPWGLIELGGFHKMRETLSTPAVVKYAEEVEAKHKIALSKTPDIKPPVLPGKGKGTEGFFDLFNEASGLTAFTIFMLTINGLIGITAQPHMLTINASGSSERAGRVGQTYGSMVKRICTVGWALTGVIVAALVVQQGAYLDDKEHAFGYACRHLLGHGWVGLLVACVVAANMAACSNLMVNAGAIFTQNIYKSCFKPHASDWELLLTGRFSGLAVTLSGVGFALIIEQVLDAFLFTETLAAFMGIMVVGGIMWRRSNRFGAAAAIFFSFVVYYILNYWDVGQLKLVYKWEAEPFAWAMAAGFAALIIFSLITRPEDHQRIDRFFDSMQRSTDLEGLPEGEPKPLAAERGQDLLLLDAPGWFSARRWHGCFQRYREDLVGFVLAWGVVCLLLLGAWGLMQIGK